MTRNWWFRRLREDVFGESAMVVVESFVIDIVLDISEMEFATVATEAGGGQKWASRIQLFWPFLCTNEVALFRTEAA